MPSKSQKNSRLSWLRHSSTYRRQWWLQHSKCRQHVQHRWEAACHLAWAVLQRVLAEQTQTLRISVGEEEVKEDDKSYYSAQARQRRRKSWNVYTKGKYLYSIETIQASFNIRLTHIISSSTITSFLRSFALFVSLWGFTRTNKFKYY